MRGTQSRFSTEYLSHTQDADGVDVLVRDRLTGTTYPIRAKYLNGFYDVQYADDRTAGRGHLFSDADGGFRFWAVTPTPYPIPHDGPVGAMFAATGRSPMRASHLHFMVTADGLRTLVTHIFVRGDEQLAADSVFGVKDSLVMDFVEQSPETPAPNGSDLGGRSWSRVRFDIVLAPAEG